MGSFVGLNWMGSLENELLLAQLDSALGAEVASVFAVVHHARNHAAAKPESAGGD